MVRTRTVIGLGVILGYLLPSLDKNSRAKAALDTLETSLSNGFAAYREAIATQSATSEAHNLLLNSLRNCQASMRVLSGDLEEGGNHIVSTAAGAVRLLAGLYLYRSLIDMAFGVVDFQPDLRFTLTEDDAISAFEEAPNGKLLVIGKLFEACGKYGCRLLEAEWAISKNGLDGSTESQRAVAHAYYLACSKTLTTLVNKMTTVDEKWAESAKRLSTAFTTA